MEQTPLNSNALYGNIDEVLNAFYQLSNLARREGLLSLESISDQSTKMPLMVRIGISLVVDGNTPEDIETILDHLIESEALTSETDIKEAKVIKSGLLCIQAGENPRVMITKMTSHLGFKKCYEHIKKDLFNFNRNDMTLFGEVFTYEEPKTITSADLEALLSPVTNDDDVSELVIAAMGEILNQYQHREEILGRPCSIDLIASAMHALPEFELARLKSQINFDDELMQAFHADCNRKEIHIKNANYLVDLMMGGDGSDFL